MRPIAVFFVSLFLFCAGYIALFHWQFSTALQPPRAEYAYREMTLTKRFIMTRAGAEKVILLGGSNVLFGMNTALIAKETGRPVVNVGMHADIPTEYLVEELLPNINYGDTVVLIPEYYAFYRPRYSRWWTDQVLTWARGYYDRLSLKNRWEFMTSFSANRVFVTVLNRLLHEEIKMKTEPEIFKEVIDRWNSSAVDEYVPVYSARNLTSGGDIRRRAPTTRMSNPYYTIYYESFQMNEWEHNLAAIVSMIHSKGAHIVASWPPTARLPNSSPDNAILSKNIKRIEELYQHHGIPMVGQFFDYLFPQEFFYDTRYHLMQEGADARSTILAKQLVALPLATYRKPEPSVEKEAQAPAAPQ